MNTNSQILFIFDLKADGLWLSNSFKAKVHYKYKAEILDWLVDNDILFEIGQFNRFNSNVLKITAKKMVSQNEFLDWGGIIGKKYLLLKGSD